MQTTERPEAVEKAAGGASGAPLSRKQKMYLCKWARQAWEQAGRPYYDDQDPDIPACFRLTKSQALELWRHEEQVKACGKSNLTTCTQRDYLELRAHWKMLLGDARQAARDAIESSVDERQVALHKLRSECALALDAIDKPMDYAAAIAWRRYRERVENLSPKQVWSLIITIRSRAYAKRRAA